MTEGLAPEVQQGIAQWLAEHPDYDGVIWTGLAPNWEEKVLEPLSADSVIRVLLGLSGAELESAREYIARAPRQVRTPIRAAIEARLGPRWTGQ